MIELTRPGAFIPVHGTRHHLERHAELARDAGCGETLVIENGEIGELSPDGRLAKTGQVTAGRVATYQLAPLADEVIRDRAQIGRSGVVFVSVVLSETGAVAMRPVLAQSGVVGPLDEDVLGISARAAERALRDVDEARSTRREDAYVEVTKGAVRRTIEAETGMRPVIHVTVQRLRDGQKGPAR